MDFNKLRQSGNDYHVTRFKAYEPMLVLDNYVQRVFDFAYGMTFGKEGHHRTHRTGGQYGRKNGELFINAFQGKMAEFGIFKMFAEWGINTTEPDLEMWGEGKWDNSDLIINGVHISIKSTSSKGNLLLLETKDWNEQGQYIPNIEIGTPDSGFHIMTRLGPDGKKLMSTNRWMYLNEIDKTELLEECLSQKWTMDVMGYITKEDLIEIIKTPFILPQNSLLNGWMKMDAENYYCQAGDLRDIQILINKLKI